MVLYFSFIHNEDGREQKASYHFKTEEKHITLQGNEVCPIQAIDKPADYIFVYHPLVSTKTTKQFGTW